MDTNAYPALVREHRDRIFSFASYTLRHREDAEDVTQDVLIRLWHHLETLDAERVGAWLTRVTRNACYDVARKRQVRQAVHTAGDPEPQLQIAASHRPGPDTDADHADFRRRLERALSELAEPYRSIVVLREIQGRSYNEIADAVDKPLNTVKVYLHRGRKMLREALAEVNPYAHVHETHAHAS